MAKLGGTRGNVEFIEKGAGERSEVGVTPLKFIFTSFMKCKIRV